MSCLCLVMMWPRDLPGVSCIVVRDSQYSFLSPKSEDLAQAIAKAAGRPQHRDDQCGRAGLERLARRHLCPPSRQIRHRAGQSQPGRRGEPALQHRARDARRQEAPGMSPGLSSAICPDSPASCDSRLRGSMWAGVCRLLQQDPSTSFPFSSCRAWGHPSHQRQRDSVID